MEYAKTSSADMLSRLLANENINIVYANHETASFDLLTRTLTLPAYQGFNDKEELMLRFHEVGHALFTDAEQYMGCIEKEKGKRHFGQYMNVLEDVREERKIKDRYPGSRKDFHAGYKSLTERDFFGVSGKDLNSLCLIDRINLYYKAGISCGVTFTKEERAFVRAADLTETVADVYALALQVYAYSAEKEKQRKLQLSLPSDLQQEGNEPDEYDFDDLGDESDEYELDSEEGEGDSSEGEEQEEGDSEEERELPGNFGGNEGDDNCAPESLTQNSFDRNICDFVESDKYERFYIEPRNRIEPLVVGYKQIVADFKKASSGGFWEKQEARRSDWQSFKIKNSKAVAHMVKEFEMRKAATRYSRTSVSDTGTLAERSLFKYKFSEDLFRKSEVVFDEQNHSFLMLLDWSGSMNRNLADSVAQVISIASFCRKGNIPFQVFAFSDQYATRKFLDGDPNSVPTPKINSSEKYGLIYGSHVSLLNFFSSKMTQSEFDLISEMLYSLAFRVAPGLVAYSLGGTPLSESYAWLTDYIDVFKKEMQTQKVTVITVTDGNGQSVTIHRPRARDYRSTKVERKFLRCPKTSAIFRVDYSPQISSELLALLRHANPEVTFVGFFISDGAKSMRSFDRVSGGHLYSTNRGQGIRDAAAAVRKNGYFDYPSKDHDKLFVISATREANDGEMKINDVMNSRQLSNQLSNSFSSIGKHRVVLSKFIETIA